MFLHQPYIVPVLHYPGTYLNIILTFVLCLLFDPCIYFMCSFASLLSFYLCFAMLASVLSLLQGPRFHVIVINLPALVLSALVLSVPRHLLLSFYFRFTFPALVLSLLHHSYIRFSFLFTIYELVLFLFYRHRFHVILISLTLDYF